MSDHYGSTEVAALLGISERELDKWLKAGILTREAPAGGTGAPRRFSFRDVVLVALAKDLAGQQMPVEGVRQAVVSARESWTDGRPESAGQLLMFMGNSPVVKWCPLSDSADWTGPLGGFFCSPELAVAWGEEATGGCYTQVNLAELARSVNDLIAGRSGRP